MERERLYRSRHERMLGGVCGGLAEYFNVDPTLVRLIVILLIFLDGFGLIAYLLAWILIPLEPKEVSEKKTNDVAQMQNEEEKVSDVIKDERKRKQVLGGFLIVLGALFLIRNFVEVPLSRFVWPLILIIIGVYLILHSNF